jgi:hypothetical protein
VLQFYVVVALINSDSTPRYELRLLDFEEENRQRLTHKFLHEADKFTRKKHEVNFDPGYMKAERGEILVARGFTLPDTFVEDVRHPTHCDKISAEDLHHKRVKAVVGASADNETGIDIAVFKELSGTRVLSDATGSLAFLLHRDTLVEADDPGFIIPEPVHAVYRDGNLYFQSYDTAKKFVDLGVIYRDASREDVNSFLQDSPVSFEGADSDFYDFIDTWSLRRISLIINNPVWETISVDDIRLRSSSLPVSVETTPDGASIVLPNDKSRLRELLKLLNRNIGREVLTDELIYSGSQIPLDSS